MRLSNTNRFWLPGTNNKALHLATILDGLREYMCFFLDGKVYIEQITGGSLEFIEDDSLAEELTNFLCENKVLEANKPILSDDVWLNMGKNK